MKTIVQKYGGSSVATPEQINHVASKVIETKKQGYHVVVVLSALGNTTDHLVGLSQEISLSPSRRELDMLLSVGERISIALLAMAIVEQGHPAVSLTGSQVGIITNTDHSQARILEIRTERLCAELNKGKIVVVAGYQGVSTEKEITTLGRGGSDTTAVALAAALQAERCEIVSDVDGVYSANPKQIESAVLLPELSHDEMLEMADSGSQILKATAVEFAKRHNIRIHLGSSRNGHIGTIVTSECLDNHRVAAIVGSNKVGLLRLRNCSDEDRYQIVERLLREAIDVKTVDSSTHICSLLLADDGIRTTSSLINRLSASWPRVDCEVDDSVGLVSIVGAGVGTGSNIISETFEVFSRLGVLPISCSFSQMRLSFCLPEESVIPAVQSLHDVLISRKLHGPESHNPAPSNPESVASCAS